MLLRCPHCRYVWDYKGRQEYYATCPRCRYRVNIKKNRVELRGEDDGR